MNQHTGGAEVIKQVKSIDSWCVIDEADRPSSKFAFYVHLTLLNGMPWSGFLTSADYMQAKINVYERMQEELNIS